MKRSFLRSWGLVLVGFFLGVFAALVVEEATVPLLSPDHGTVKTDTPSMERLITASDHLNQVSTQKAETEIREVFNDCSNFITSPPVVTSQGFDNVGFNIHKNSYSVPLKFPKAWIGLGYGYPWGIRVSGGYRIKNRLMLFTVLSKEDVSLSAALFL